MEIALGGVVVGTPVALTRIREPIPLLAVVKPPSSLAAIMAWEPGAVARHPVGRRDVEMGRESPTRVVAHDVGRDGLDRRSVVGGDCKVQARRGEDAN